MTDSLRCEDSWVGCFATTGSILDSIFSDARVPIAVSISLPSLIVCSNYLRSITREIWPFLRWNFASTLQTFISAFAWILGLFWILITVVQADFASIVSLLRFSLFPAYIQLSWTVSVLRAAAQLACVHTHDHVPQPWLTSATSQWFARVLLQKCPQDQVEPAEQVLLKWLQVCYLENWYRQELVWSQL